jgi:hypothetical protein
MGDQDDPAERVVPSAVWCALLSADYPNLRPFRPRDSATHGESGLGLPLGVLADVQIYTTDADSLTLNNGHSPFCQHAWERGVTRDYDLRGWPESLHGSPLRGRKT